MREGRSVASVLHLARGITRIVSHVAEEKKDVFLGNDVLQDLLKQALMKHDVHLSVVHNTEGEKELHPLIVSFICVKCLRRFST